MKNYLSLILLLTCLCGCGSSKPKVYVDPAAVNKIQSKCPSIKGKDLLVYYLDGSCSFCISKADEIEKSLKANTKKAAVFVATTQNANVTLFNFEQANIKSCIIIDDSARFEKFLPLNSVTLVKPDGEIISQTNH